MDPANLTGDELVAAHRAVARKLLIATIVFPLVVIAIIVFHLAAIARQIGNIDSAAVAAEAAERFGALWPEVQGYLGEVASAMEPVLTHAVDTETAAMAPVIEQRLQADIASTAESAQRNFTQAVDRSIAELEERQRALLLAELPVLTNDRAAQDLVIGAARESLVTWSTDQFQTALDEHMTAMTAIRETLESSYTAPAGKPAEPEDALMLWLELLNQRVGGESFATEIENSGKGHGRRKPQPAVK